MTVSGAGSAWNPILIPRFDGNWSSFTQGVGGSGAAIESSPDTVSASGLVGRIGSGAAQESQDSASGSGSTSGAVIADGNPYTMTGNWFGSDPSGDEFLGGVNGPVNTLALGSTFNSLNRPNWTQPGNEPSKSSNLQSFTGYRVLSNDSLLGTVYQFGRLFNTQGRYRAMYARYYLYIDTPWTGDLQIKTTRAVGTNITNGGISDADRPNLYFTDYHQFGAGDYFAINAGTAGTQWATGALQFNTWVLLEMEVKPDSAVGAGDAYLRILITRCSDNVALVDNTFSGISVWGSAESTRVYQYICQQLYFGNYGDNPARPWTSVTLRLFADGEYFAWNPNTSDSPKIVLVGDQSTWNACNYARMSVCKKNGTYSNTSVPILLTRGAQNNLTGKYLYITQGIKNPLNPGGNGYPLV